jgi:hypothetical protein
MYASAFVLGFHGCDERVGERVLAGQTHLRSSGNVYDWLGHGIYFWENSPKRALQWAEYVAAHPKRFATRIERPFVLGAIIDLGRCLDLTEAGSLEIVKAGYEDMKRGFDAVGAPLPTNDPAGDTDEDLVKRKLDCAVINFVHELRENEHLDPFDSVRGAFFEGRPLYEGARISAKTHIQLCVRNSAAIHGYFRPLTRTDAV